MTTTPSTTFDLPGFGGQLIHPGDAEYDEAAAGLQRHDRPLAGAHRPVRQRRRRRRRRRTWPASSDLPLSVYGGGHGVTGSAVVDAGVCVDLRGMKGVDVDPDGADGRASRAALTWGEVDAATQEHGLAVTGGRVSDTGVAGLTLGSGSGWLERKFGFVCDNLLEAEVVTADGRRSSRPTTRTPTCSGACGAAAATSASSPRSTSGSTRSARSCSAGMLMYPAAMAGELVRFYRDFMPTAPDEVGSGLAFITAPPEDFVPEPVRGQPVVGVVVLLRRPGRGRRGGVPAAARVRPASASTWSSRCRTSRCSSCSTRRTRRACRTTGPPTSSPSCPTRRSTRSSSTPRSRSRR